MKITGEALIAICLTLLGLLGTSAAAGVGKSETLDVLREIAPEGTYRDVVTEVPGGVYRAAAHRTGRIAGVPVWAVPGNDEFLWSFGAKPTVGYDSIVAVHGGDLKPYAVIIINPYIDGGGVWKSIDAGSDKKGVCKAIGFADAYDGDYFTKVEGRRLSHELAIFKSSGGLLGFSMNPGSSARHIQELACKLPFAAQTDDIHLKDLYVQFNSGNITKINGEPERHRFIASPDSICRYLGLGSSVFSSQTSCHDKEMAAITAEGQLFGVVPHYGSGRWVDVVKSIKCKK